MILKKNLYLLISIIIALLSIYFAQNFKLDASSDTLILKNDETFNYYQYYNKIFPSKNFLVLAIKSKDEINNQYIKNLNKIKTEINKLNNIESTFSIVDAPILLLNNLSLSDLTTTEIENINNSQNNLDLILNEFSNSPIFKDQIINSSKNLSAMIIYIKKNKHFEKLKEDKKNLPKSNIKIKEINNQYKIEKEKNNLNKEKLIKNIREILNNKNNDYEYFLGGIDMITSDTINFIKKDIAIFSVAVILFIIIVLFFIYRNIKWVLIPLITTAYAVLTMLGLIGMMNWEITAISANFISLMLILSISMNIHIINHYKLNYFNQSINHKIKNTIKKMFLPCFYTALTTIVAFGSLLFSNIKPIIDFGSIMIFALIIIFITSFTFLPLLINLFPKINKNTNLNFSILNTFYKLSLKNIKLILITNLVIFIISLLGIYKLNVENSFINYFKANTEIHKGMKIIDKELGGTTPLDIIIKFKNEETEIHNTIINEDPNIDEELELDLDENLFVSENVNQTWFTKEKLNTIEKIHKYLELKDEIGKVQSLHSLIEMGNLINKKSLSIFELSILYKEIPENYKEKLINPFLSIDNNMVKISARIKDSNKISRNDLIKEINEYLLLNFDNIEEIRVNGLLVLYNNMLQSLFNSQIKSFGIILLSIFIMFIILFKSLKLSIIAMVPNIIASTFIIGLIGLIGIPLDIMTITIAAITIGIAVDNTIHYIYKININRKLNYKKEKSIEEAHKTVGNAVLTTSLTISFGFSVLCLSNFIPTILFGTFTALAMIIAMVGVLLTLPTLLYKF